MKMQWVLVAVVLVAAVFVFTYLKINSGGSRDNPPPPPPGTPDVMLYFPRTASREKEQGTMGTECEYGVAGYYDFWFENIHPQPIDVGLAHKKPPCCTKVEAALAGDDWKTWNAAVTLDLIMRIHGRLENLASDLVAWRQWAPQEPERGWKLLSDKPKDPGITVPPKASGWVRVHWQTENVGFLFLQVGLWTHSADGGAPLTELTVPVNIVLPASVDGREKEVGTLSPDKPVTNPVMFTFWSSTRSSFTVMPAKISDPFVIIGKPIPLAGEECRELEGNKLKKLVRVVSACRIPVSVRERLDDGRQLDIGPFKRPVFLEMEGVEETLEVTVTGVVQGEVSVLSPDGPNRIQMGNKGYFDAAYGDSKEATLETRNLDLDLAIDQVPSFLRAELGSPRISGGIKTWGIRVEVPKRAVAGEFPRDDNPEYRDSAVYLKMIDAKNPGATPRRIRIPVSGKASSR